MLNLWPVILWYILVVNTYEKYSPQYTSFIDLSIALGLVVSIYILNRLELISRQTVWIMALFAGLIGFLTLSNLHQLWENYFAVNRLTWDFGYVLSNSDANMRLSFSLAILSLAIPIILPAFERGLVKTWFDNLLNGGSRKDSHGSARWMKLDEAKLKLGTGSLVLGEAYEPSQAPFLAGRAPLLRSDGSGHLLTVAGSGGGKTTSIVIPNCLEWDSCLIVHDPKGELAHLCSEARQRKGRKVYVLNSNNEDSDSINVLDWLDPNDKLLVEHARAVVSWLGSGEEPSGENASFETKGRDLVLVAILEVVCNDEIPKEKKNLLTVRRLLTNPDLIDILESISEKEEGFSFGAAQQYASELYGLAIASERTWSGVLFQASDLISWLSAPSLAKLVCGQGTGKLLNSQDITDGKVDIFISIPLRTLESTPAVTRLIFGALFNRIYMNFEKTQTVSSRTLFLVDEMPRLGHFKPFETARDAGRGYGITFWGIVQDLGQLEKAYQKEGCRSWLENSQIKNFFGIGDYESAKLLSDILGKETIVIDNTTTSGGPSSGSFEGLGGIQRNNSTSEQSIGRELMTVDEIMRMTVDEQGVPDEQIILVRNRPPIRCGLAKWYRRKDFTGMINS